MRRLVSTAALSVICLLFFSPWPGTSRAQSQDMEEAIREVVVYNRGEERFVRVGTAFHVGGGLFYTNAHVVRAKVPEGYTEWYLASKTSTRYISSWLGPFTVTCVHPRWQDRGDPVKSYPYDVALVKTAAPSQLPSFTFSDKPVTVGQRVAIKGFPSASRAWPPILYTATGRTSEVRWQDQTFYIEIESGFALGGSSGSPVMADDGRVVGINYAGFGVENRTASSRMVAVLASAAQTGCPR